MRFTVIQPAMNTVCQRRKLQLPTSFATAMARRSRRFNLR
jgi:hypothetical protein